MFTNVLYAMLLTFAIDNTITIKRINVLSTLETSLRGRSTLSARVVRCGKLGTMRLMMLQ